MGINPKLTEVLNKMKVLARRIGQVKLDCKLELNLEEYVDSFQPHLVPAVLAWASGSSFADASSPLLPRVSEMSGWRRSLRKPALRFAGTLSLPRRSTFERRHRRRQCRCDARRAERRRWRPHSPIHKAPTPK